ncbi:GntP family permease [Alteromonas aestuariivivens]|uniref:GntP family permease n=1 Tax=Alteromonas aestuariivivens TaxID=1938339 RepID=A0A3D8M6Y0_9ALTE|nr:GntP family permease [Alteromonas aestuariivivens]RDV25465.1 GntP family permease [Alteromonas aestuariivivens]
MQDAVFYSSPFYLLLVGLVALFTLVFLIIRCQLHAFIALLLVSIGTALACGIPAENLVPTLLSGLGSTLASVALLVGLGSMIGKILQVSGGATVLAETLIRRFGEDRAPLALGIASLLFGFPIFFDAGLMVMMPILMSVASRVGGSSLTYALPAAGAFAVMHALVPPHPGPVAAGELLGADLGLLLVCGICIAIPTWYLGAYCYGLYAGKRFYLPISRLFSDPGELPVTDAQPPAFSLVLAILLTPVLLIFLDTGLSTLLVAGAIQPAFWVDALRLVGKTPVALLITLLLCLLLFGRRFGQRQLNKLCSESLAPICVVVLVTGAGGMFGGVLRAGGIGDALAGALNDTGMPAILAAFVIAACLRVAQGSATVALTTTAALIAPIVDAATGLSSLDICFIVIAIAGGATVLSHFNDSGFWLVSRLLDMDEKTTLQTWTVMETLLGCIAFVLAACLSVML